MSSRRIRIHSPLHNKGLKILAVVLAIVSWYAIRGVISFETLVNNVPIIIWHDSGWAVMDRSTDVVDIEFRGSRSDLLRLNRDTVELVIDLRGHELAGDSIVRFDPIMVAAPGSARAITFQPIDIQFSLDRQATTQLPVKADLQGRPSSDYEMIGVETDPVSVTVSGPRRLIEQLTSIRTEPIPLKSRKRTFRERVKLLPPDETWDAIIEPSRVNVRVSISERSEVRAFRALPVDVMVNPAQEELTVTVNPVTIQVSVKGIHGALKNIDKETIKPFVDATQLKAGDRYELPVKLLLPDGISADSLNPSSVSVSIESE